MTTNAKQPVEQRLVALEVTEGIATIALNHPEQRNALSPELVDSLVAALKSIDSDASVSCAILTGMGTSFSAGGNPKRMLESGLYVDMTQDEIRKFYRDGIQRIPLAFEQLEVPVIAAVNGPAIGAGLDLASLCDVRIAAETAIFSSSFVKFGLVPGDGGAWLLPRAIGASNAARMIFTGDRITAAEALQMGLVSEVLPSGALLDAARAIAKRIASNPPHAVRMAKRLLATSAKATLAEALEAARTMQALAHKTADHREAVTAFLEKRDPKFEGR